MYTKSENGGESSVSSSVSSSTQQQQQEEKKRVVRRANLSRKETVLEKEILAFQLNNDRKERVSSVALISSYSTTPASLSETKQKQKKNHVAKYVAKAACRRRRLIPRWR